MTEENDYIYRRRQWFGVQTEPPEENEKEELNAMVLKALTQWHQQYSARPMPARDLYPSELLANGVWTVSHINWTLMDIEKERRVCCAFLEGGVRIFVDSILLVPTYKKAGEAKSSSAR